MQNKYDGVFYYRLDYGYIFAVRLKGTTENLFFVFDENTKYTDTSLMRDIRKTVLGFSEDFLDKLAAYVKTGQTADGFGYKALQNWYRQYPEGEGKIQ